MVGQGAIVSGLAGVAITQPVLDLFGRNPTFFVAGNYARRQIVAFALVVAVVPPLVMLAGCTVARLVDRRLGRLVGSAAIASLSALFGLAIARSVRIDGLVPALAVAIAVGAAVAVGEWRWSTVRQFLRYLAVGNVAFLLLFLVGSPTADLLWRASRADAGTTHIPPLPGPVVVVVLDETPLAALLEPEGTIDEELYPGFAHLAEGSTWFRNAATESLQTYESVPSILTGVRAEEGALPALADHPRNYFTLFGPTHSVYGYEPVTNLCPTDTCREPARPRPPLRQAFRDATLVYGHRVLPVRLRRDLPPIDEDWGNFGGVGATSRRATTRTTSSAEIPAALEDVRQRLRDLPGDERSKPGQLAALQDRIARIEARPSVHLIHVLVPHHPYFLTPWGTMSNRTWRPRDVPRPDEPHHERAFVELHALQAFQMGAVDVAIGELVDHLHRIGAWEDTTLVVTSDHGVEITPPGFSRQLTDETRDELLRIPLFIKAPGQTVGEVRDDPASTIDVLPSLIDLLHIETDWELEGHSLFDGSAPRVPRLLESDLADLWALVERKRALFPHGDGWHAFAAIGDNGDLVGTAVDDHRLGSRSRLTWTLDHHHREAEADESATEDAVPVLMTGVVRSADEPPELVVAIEGTIAGTTGGYRENHDGWQFSGILGPPGVRGQGEEIVAYEVERTPDGVVLHPVPGA